VVPTRAEPPKTHRKVPEDGEAKMPDWGDMGLVRDLYIRFVDKLE